MERIWQEDVKFNDRVVGMFVLYEQIWKIEKKKLKCEVEFLRDEIVDLCDWNLLQKDDGEKECEDCKVKVKEFEKMEGQFCEKEFFMMMVMEEVWVDQCEWEQLVGKLEKFFKEMVKNVELYEVFVNVRRKYEEMENKLRCVMLEFDNGRREMEFVFVVKMNQNVIIEEFLDNLKSFQKDVNGKEEVIFILMKRFNIDWKEREEFLQQFVQEKFKWKVIEVEKDRWKRLVEECVCNMVFVGRDL